MAIAFKGNAISKAINKKVSEYDRASTAALNKTAGRVFTEVKREVSKDTGVKQKDFASGSKKQLFKSNATNATKTARVWATGKRIPIGRMSVKNNKRGGNVSFSNKRGKRTKIPGAFVVVRPGGKIVYKRVAGATKAVPKSEGTYRVNGKSYKDRKIARQPIVKLLGPSIPKVMSRGFMTRIINDLMTEEWPKQFEAALRSRIARAK